MLLSVEQHPYSEIAQQVSSADYLADVPSTSQQPNSLVPQHRSSAAIFRVVPSF